MRKVKAIRLANNAKFLKYFLTKAINFQLFTNYFAGSSNETSNSNLLLGSPIALSSNLKYVFFAFIEAPELIGLIFVLFVCLSLET